MRRRYIAVGGDWVPREEWTEPSPAPYVIPDIEPYKSMVTGEMIHSRSRHREHLRDHNMIEVGNDPSIMNPKQRPIQSPRGLKEKIISAANQIEDRDRRRR